MLTLAAIYMHFTVKSHGDLDPNRYVEAANCYGNMFVSQSRAQLSKLDPSETNANMACSRLLGVLSLAFHREYRAGGLHWSDSAAWKWVHLLRGVKTVHTNIITSGQTVDPVLRLDMAPEWPLRNDAAPSSPSDSSTGIDILLAYIERTKDERFAALRDLISCGQVGLDQEDRISCLAALETLADITTQVCEMKGRSVFRVLGSWIGRLSPRDVQMLESGHQAVLAVYAHWLMMLVLSEDLWFIGDMGRAGIRDVIEATSSSSEVSYVLQWPREVLRLSPASES